MQFIKMIFSRVFLSALLLILQVFLIFAAIAYFNAYYALFQAVSVLLGVAVFLKIVNKREPSEWKLPWIFLILALPLFGVTIYLLFGNVRLTRKNAATLERVTKEVTPYLSTEREKELPAEIEGISRYLRSNAYSFGSEGNRVRYFRVGEEFFDDLVKSLKEANSFIFLEYFLIFPGRMWSTIHEILVEKARAGVDVKVMYDDIGTLGRQPNGYWKKLRREGIDCRKFNPVRPVVSAIYNNRDHRKIAVIDGRIGYTGGVNIGDEYINEEKKFGHWKDTAVRIEGKEVAALTATFLSLFSLMSKEEIRLERYFPEPESYPERGFVQFFGDGPYPMYREQVGENNFLHLIYAAKESITITTPYLIIDHQTATALRNAAFRGVEVRIVTPHIPDKKMILNLTRSHYAYLLEAGVKIYEYTPGFLHAKSVLVDGILAFVGTINLDYRSLVHHFECGALLYDVPCLADLKRDLEDTISRSQEIEKDFRLKGLRLFVASVLQLFAPLF